MSDNISIAKIDVDASGVTKAAETIVQAGVIAEKGFDQMASGSEKVVKSSKQVQAEAARELAVIASTEQKKTAARQKASLAKIQLATVEAKTVEAQAKQDLAQTEQAEKRKTQLSKTRADQRLLNTKTGSTQELMILKSSLRAEEMANKQAHAIELTNIKADVKAVQDAEKSKQEAQKQTHQMQMQLLKQQMQSQRLASTGGGSIGGGRGPAFYGAQTGGGGAGAGGGGIGGGIGGNIPPIPPIGGGGGGGGVGGILTQVGAGLGGVAGGVAGLAGSLMTANIPGIISSLINLGKASMDAGNQLFKSGVAAEKASVAYQRQVVAATNLAGSQRDLQKMMDAYVEASGGAIDNAEALTNMIQLQALGFAKNADQVKSFVTAARGISLAMGKSVDDVTNQISLAVGNLSTRRLDQLGLSIDEVTKRTNELQKAHIGMARQVAFEQAIIEAATKKFGALAQSAVGQKSAVERMEADWSNFALTLSTAVAPAVDKVADIFDRLIKAATNKTLEAAIENLRNVTIPRGEGNTLPGTQTETTGKTEFEVARLEKNIAALEKIKTQPDYTPQKYPELQATIDRDRVALAQFGVDLGRLHAIESMAESKLPGGKPLPYSLDPARPSGTGDPTALQKFESEHMDMIVDEHNKETAINQKAYTDGLAADADYHQAVQKSNEAFNLQMEEQAADHGRQMEREETQYQEEVAKIKRDAADQAKKAERDLGEQIGREQRDSATEQGKWLRDYNESVSRNTRDEKDQEAKVTREYDEQKTKENDDYNKKVTDINDKFNEANTKARKDHYDNLLDAASHLDAAAVYSEQRRYLKEEATRQKDHTKDLEDAKHAHEDQIKENKSAYDEQIGDMQKANDTRNADEKAAYNQRVSDANDALQQQISDQKDALAQQLEDAKTADDQRLTDMQTAHDNQKTQEELDYGLQLDREKTHHTNELTELDTQHNNRINQIKQQQFEEQQLLQNEWEKQVAAEGIASGKYIDQQNILQATSLAIFEEWWKKQNQVMLGVVPEPSPDNTAFGPMISKLQEYGQQLQLQLGTAVARTDTAEMKRVSGLIDELKTSLGLYGQTLNPLTNDPTVQSSSVVIKTDAPVVSSASVSGGMDKMSGVGNVTMGDISIYLGDIGNRSDNDVKKLVGDAMVYWIGQAANVGTQARW